MTARRPGRRTAEVAVNLLSPWSFESLEARRLRRRFAGAAALLVLVLAAAWALQHLRAVQAEQVLAIEEAERTTLSSQVAELAPVRAFVAGVDKRATTVSETMRGEVRFSELLAELAMATPADADLTDVAVTVTPPPLEGAAAGSASGSSSAVPAADPATTTDPAATTASACPGPDPFGTRPVVGCVTLSGTASSREAVGQLVVELDRSSVFVEPFISTTTVAEGPQVTFSGTVGVAPRAFTRRFDRIDLLLRERTDR